MDLWPLVMETGIGMGMWEEGVPGAGVGRHKGV